MSKIIKLDDMLEGAMATRQEILKVLTLNTGLTSYQIFNAMIAQRDNRRSQERFSKVEIARVLGGHVSEMPSDVFDLMIKAYGDFDILQIVPPLEEGKNIPENLRHFYDPVVMGSHAEKLGDVPSESDPDFSIFAQKGNSESVDERRKKYEEKHLGSDPDFYRNYFLGRS